MGTVNHKQCGTKEHDMGKYRKSRAFSPDGFFECEGRGLQWLGAAHAQGGPRVVEVYEWGRDFLDIERVNSCSPTPKAAYDFGAALARMHDSGAEFFGSAPAGYMGTCYFGPLQDPVPMDCGTWTDPATYLAEGRLRPMVELGIRRRELTDADMGLTEEVIQALPEVVALLGTYDITTIRASIGMYLVCKAIHEQTDVRVLMTGEISDELFGYKYTDFAPSAEAFQQEAKKRVDELYMYDVLRADRCISVNSLEARVPFGDLDFVKYVMSIRPELKLNTYDMGKYLLRKAFADDHILPDDILWRQKAAFSDAVGHSMVDDLKAYAESLYSDEAFGRGCEKYTFAKPFTKESLLYRDIFEKYYPGQADMVKDFWMPNKAWKGCDVKDPSARVLSNYGASGK